MTFQGCLSADLSRVDVWYGGRGCITYGSHLAHVTLERTVKAVPPTTSTHSSQSRTACCARLTSIHLYSSTRQVIQTEPPFVESLKTLLLAGPHFWHYAAFIGREKSFSSESHIFKEGPVINPHCGQWKLGSTFLSALNVHLSVKRWFQSTIDHSNHPVSTKLTKMQRLD